MATGDDIPDPRPQPEPDGIRDGWLERLLGRFTSRAREGSRDALEEALTEATEAADLSARERLMLKNVLGFHRLRVSDVMVPRADMVAVASDTSLADVLGLFRAAGHSRIPVYGETLDEPLGMVHIRDFLSHITGLDAPPEGGDVRPPASLTDLTADLAAARIVRPVLFVPRSMPAIDLLARMQASRTHMALVIDEYGGTDGLVSIEDLVETVVGDIEDEHDEVEHMIVRDEAGELVADARAGLEEVSEALGLDLRRADAEIDTLGGLIVTSVGRVPARGELIAGPLGLEFEVLDADPRRLKRVRVHRRPQPADGIDAASGPDPAAEGAKADDRA